MKIVAILDYPITAGGGYQQSINAILQMKHLCLDLAEFTVFTTSAQNISVLRDLGINAIVFSYRWRDRLLAMLCTNAWWQAIQKRLEYIGPFEKHLIAFQCNLVYFLNPTKMAGALQQLNYIITVWDLCHRDMPEFPEVRTFGKFHSREDIFQHHLTPAMLVLADSTELADRIAWRYGVDRERILPMPFSPASHLTTSNHLGITEVLSEYTLEPGYFFYPSQFWAHKNHSRILEALLLLQHANLSPILVFAGSDQGNRRLIEQLVSKLGLEQQVRILGYVPASKMYALYSGCRAVIMPTYFGPTNLPPLEAWALGKPLIYSSLFAAQTKDAAILVNPDNATQIAEAISSCFDQEFCNTLVVKGYGRLAQIQDERQCAELEFKTKISTYKIRLQL